MDMVSYLYTSVGTIRSPCLLWSMQVISHMLIFHRGGRISGMPRTVRSFPFWTFKLCSELLVLYYSPAYTEKGRWKSSNSIDEVSRVNRCRTHSALSHISTYRVLQQSVVQTMTKRVSSVQRIVPPECEICRHVECEICRRCTSRRDTLIYIWM